ncbi:MAG TPA: 2-hydroxycarboxylate transporter family protein [Caulobacteraceae bacterium]|jgi:CCS family citrate carrier protein
MSAAEMPGVHEAEGARPSTPWGRVLSSKVGILPLPLFLLQLALIWAFLKTGKPPSDLLMAMVVLTAGGFGCAELGRRLPWLRHVGAPAILATFLPSYLVYARLLPQPLIDSVGDFTKQSNFLYLFIAAIIVGSILGMDRRVLIKGFVKIFVPLFAGSLAGMLAGCLMGTLLGLGLRQSFFFVVAPIMAGGVGEGAIPLSIGYGLILHKPQGELFAQVLPPVMLGSLTAILISGGLNFLGKCVPRWTGEGQLQPQGKDVLPEARAAEAPNTPAIIAAAAVGACCFYLIGVLTQRLWNWPAPVTMLFIAVALKLGRILPPWLEGGAKTVGLFFSSAATYPLLFAIGVAMTPWDKLVAAYSPAMVITVVATVMAMIGAGFFAGRLMKMYPIDAAVVTACHSGQGGTGDVAILTAANRLALMPFAQIATRIGGAVTVTAVLILLARLT